MDEHDLLLTLLPQRKLHWASLVTSFGAQIAAVSVVLLAGVLQPNLLVPVKPAVYQVVQLIGTPPPQRPAAPPPRNLQPAPVEVPKLLANVPLRALARPVRTPETAPAPRLELARKDLGSLLPPSRPARPVEPVRTGVFSTGSQAVADTNRPAHEVQTGGFGDPNGIKGEGKDGAKLRTASLGSFDLPSGPGYGNGTGGANGVRGTVVSAGFGNGVASGTGDAASRGRDRGSIQQAGFGDSRPMADQPRIARPPVPAVAAATPVQLLSKPAPAYTEEARQLKLEGEVMLEVTFLANGECRVLRVVHGLGHGLDEAATRAARQIRFRPATRDREPVDSTATLRVVFQLAY